MSERLQFTCPGCRKSVRVPVEWADRTLKCKACGSVINRVVPMAAPLPVTAPSPPSRHVPVATAVPPLVVVLPEMELPPEEDGTDPVPSRSRYRPGRKGNPVVWAGAAVLCLAATVGGILYATGVFPAAPATRPTEVVPVEKGTTSTLAASAVPYPRRLLFVSVSRYAFLNPLATGAAGGNSAGEAARKLAYEWRVPTDAPNNQFYFLSDTARKDSRPVVKSVVVPTFDRFFETSREQDCLVVAFSGHAVEKEGKAFLAPSDGDPDDPESLIAVDDLFTKMKACPARQKVLILDVCRFNPQFGRQRPGSEPMSEGLAKALHSPPAGVQVWTTCSTGENAVELPKTGGEFFAAFRSVAEKGKLASKSGQPEDPIPISDWANVVDRKVAELVTKDGKAAQTPRLTGAEPKPASALNAEELPAKRFDFPALPKGADPAAVAAAFRDLDLPGIRDDRSADYLSLDTAFYFADGVMKDYAGDDLPMSEWEKDREKYAIRFAAVDALKVIRNSWTRTKGDGSGRLRETFAGEADDKTKKLIEDEQTVPARIILELEIVLRKLEAAEKSLDKEPSKRWRATLQYAHAQALIRWAYITEYNLMLGAIRKNELPELNKGKGETGWQMVSAGKMRSKADVKEKAEAAKELFAKIAAEHKGTPWALLAKQHLNIAVGLEWRAYNPSEGVVRDSP